MKCDGCSGYVRPGDTRCAGCGRDTGLVYSCTGSAILIDQDHIGGNVRIGTVLLTIPDTSWSGPDRYPPGFNRDAVYEVSVREVKL